MPGQRRLRPGQHKGSSASLPLPLPARHVPPAPESVNNQGTGPSFLPWREKSPPRRAEQQQLWGLEFSKHRDITNHRPSIDIASHIRHRYSPPHRPNPPSSRHPHPPHPHSFSRRLISTTFFSTSSPNPPRASTNKAAQWLAARANRREERAREARRRPTMVPRSSRATPLAPAFRLVA